MAPLVTHAGASFPLPEGYTLGASGPEGLQASDALGGLLQLLAKPVSLPRAMLGLLRGNRDQFLQILGAQVPSLLMQAVAAQADAEPSARHSPIASQVVALPSGSALFASTQVFLRGQERTLALWLLAPPSLKQFYVLSLAYPGDLAQAQALMAPTLASLQLRD